MKRPFSRTLFLSGVAVATLIPVTAASAVEFSPSTHVRLSSRHTGVAVRLVRTLGQDSGEEGIKGMYFSAPAGFRIATYRQLEDGEQVGKGVYTIADQPFCNELVQETLPIKIFFHTPTLGAQKDGVKAIWTVEDQLGDTMVLRLRGNARNGWFQSGENQSDNGSCPPGDAKVTIFRRSSVTKTPIIRNPRQPGRYTFTTIFTSWGGYASAVEQVIRIHR